MIHDAAHHSIVEGPKRHRPRRLEAVQRIICPSHKLLQQRLRLDQIRRVKPLSKPSIHRGEQVGGVLALILGLPQASQAGGGAEFPGFGLLASGDGEGLLEADFGC